MSFTKEHNIPLVKRSGASVKLSEAKLHQRLENLSADLDKRFVDFSSIISTVVNGVTDNMTTTQLDELLSETVAYMGTKHPDYSLLAGRLCATHLHKRTVASFTSTVEMLYRFVNSQTGEAASLIADNVYEFVMANKEALDAAMDYTRDLRFDYFGYKTLERSYLLRVENRKIAERPSHMYMRVSCGIHCGNLEKTLETYNLMSQGYFIHASPTLFNAGTPRCQLSSCFLVALKDDSIDGIYDSLKTCALISKNAGGIGLHVHNVRALGSYIRGTNGMSNGIVPMLRVFNDTARYVDQGGGKRKGAIAIYLEPWHADVFEFLSLKKNTGKEENRARDLFYALWIPDLFMKRVKANGTWSLMCPNECPGLADVWGPNFEEKYEAYEKAGKVRKTVKAQELWFAILESQIETGTPYMLFKDACNSKSNHQNLGTIKSSNLCTEIVEYSDDKETAVCNLASLSLPACVNKETKTFDHDLFCKTVKVATRNLNNVIDINHYPTEDTRRSNMRHRPIGLGIQGLADVFLLLQLPFTSEEAQRLNEDIFETLYYAAMTASMEVAKEKGAPYESYHANGGCPVSKGIFQFDMWGVKPKSGRWDWAALKRDVAKHGVYNSLLVAPMPTASTSQILGNNECFEPFTSNLYVRRCLAGEFPMINKYLVRDLAERGLWNETIRNAIIAFNGSIQAIDLIPENIKDRYKTVWEMKQRHMIDMAQARAVFIDQSQSLNLFLESPTAAMLTSMHFYSWERGLKTGMYYLRTRPAADAIKFTVDAKSAQEMSTRTAKRIAAVSAEEADPKRPKVNADVADPTPEEGCLSCGS